MAYQVLLIPVVYKDLQKAKKSYREKSEKLAQDFKYEVDREIEYIKSHPNNYQINYKSLRQALVSRFPYAIFYFN